MKRDLAIDGRAARLEVDGVRFRFEREGAIVEREAELTEVEPGVYSVLIEGRSYEASTGAGWVEVGGRRFQVEITDARSARRRGGRLAEGRTTVSAPMPGKVVRVLTSQGEVVEAGQGLVVVEAMKMQNELKAPRSGRVVEMRTREGAAVAAGEPLAVIE